MAKEFFHPDMELCVDHRVDWERYLRLSRREAADVAGEIDTYKMILRTLAEICEDIDARAGEHWHEEVRVEDGRVVVPPHVAQAYEKLRSAGLVCLTLIPQYRGQNQPLLLHLFYFEIIPRGDARPMTDIRFQARG